MLRLILVLAVLVVVATLTYAGHHEPKHGWGWKKYNGWAQVQGWQSPHNYQYSLNEHGKDYSRYAWAQQEFKGGWQG